MRKRRSIALLIIAVLSIALLVYYLTREQSGAPVSIVTGIRLNEVMTSNKGAVRDANGNYPDYVEIANVSDKSIDLSGFGLSDDKLSPAKWVFPTGTVLAPGGFIVVYCTGNTADGELYAGFKLSATDDLILMDSTGKAIDSLALKQVAADSSLGVDESGSWVEQARPSPGYPNTADGIAAYESGLASQTQDIGVVINEFMASNATTITDKNGNYSDWVELYNTTSAAVDLSGLGLSDDPGRPAKWVFPDGVTIQPNGYLLLFLSGISSTTAEEELHVPFGLRAYEEAVVLSAKNGAIIDSYEYKEQQTDTSMARMPDGSGEFAATSQPTPGYPNTEQGFLDFEAAHMSSAGPVVISEAMAANHTVLEVGKDNFPDWIELSNTASDAVDLSGWGLTDNPKNPAKWKFPEGASISGGEYMVVLANGGIPIQTDGDDVKKKYIEATFALSGEGDTIYLFNAEGVCQNKLSLGRARADISVGREGAQRLVYQTPTPGSANSGGMPGFAQDPSILLASGKYDGAVNVELAVPEGTSVTYTLDCTEPTQSSTAYTGAISIPSTGVLRARAFKQGYLPSAISTATYVIGSEHTLPIVSLVTEPDNLWSETTGIYTKGAGAAAEYPFTGANFFNEWERPVHLDIIDESGALEHEQDAVFRIFGAYSRGKDQKAFAVIARAGYGPSTIQDKIFDDRPYAEYKSIVLRAGGQDSTISRIRDVLITSLVGDGTDLAVQAYRPCVVYLDGKYWGVYFMREKINKHFLSQHYDIADPDSIDLLVGNGSAVTGTSDGYKAMLEYATTHDLSQKEHYDYICNLVDVKNLAEYTAMEIYVGNTDTGNIKYWKSPNTKWQWLTYDFCWGMNSSSTVGYSWNSFAKYLSEKGHGVGSGFSNKLIKSLLKNSEFEEIFLQACAKMVNEVFTPEKVVARVDEIEALIDAEMVRDTELWDGMSYEGWKKSVNRLREFAQNRPSYFIRYAQEQFGLSNSKTTEVFGRLPE